MDTETVIHETELVAGNIRAMLKHQGLEPSKGDVASAVDAGVLQIDATRDGALARVIFLFPRGSKYAEHAPQMEPFLRRFFAGHNKAHARVPVMVVYHQVNHFVAALLRKFRASQRCGLETHRDEIFLQRPTPELVPRHTVVQDRARLAEQLGKGFEERLSRIYTGDKMAVWVGARAKDVIHVEYPSASAGSQPQYLYVVPGDPMVSQRVNTAADEDEPEEAEDAISDLASEPGEPEEPEEAEESESEPEPDPESV